MKARALKVMLHLFIGATVRGQPHPISFNFHLCEKLFTLFIVFTGFFGKEPDAVDLHIGVCFFEASGSRLEKQVKTVFLRLDSENNRQSWALRV